MALVHDLAESMVGDITPHDGVTKEEKYQRELVSGLLQCILSTEVYCGLLESNGAHQDSGAK